MASIRRRFITLSELNLAYQEERFNFKRWVSASLALLGGVIFISAVIYFIQRSADILDRPYMCPPHFKKPPLILIGMDGFKYSYLTQYDNKVKTIKELMNHGVSGAMKSMYPTKTFPNLYTIVTGLYPESHGIIDNKILDPSTGRSFSLSSQEKFNSMWYGGEPVWVTAFKQGVTSGVIFWPGSDVAIQGYYPKKYFIYNHSMPFMTRVNILLNWLAEKEDPLQFYILYFHEPDSSGHAHGPDDDKVGESLSLLDQAVKNLLNGLDDLGLISCVNIILVSDHGMQKAESAKIINGTDYFGEGVSLTSGPAPRVRAKNQTSLLAKNCQTKDQPFIVMDKKWLPKRLHYSNNVRIEKTLIYMEDGWQFTDERGKLKHSYGGFHGSDNAFKSMLGIFIAYGSKFMKGVSISLENIQVYNLICDLLDIFPSNNNGTLGSLNRILKKPKYLEEFPGIISEASSCNGQKIDSPPIECNCDEATITSFTFSEDQDDCILPFGKPEMIRDHPYCILNNTHFIVGYSKILKMPIWVSFTLTEPQVYTETSCILKDNRIMYTENCYFYSNQQITFGHIYPPNLNDSQSLLDSNVSPMYDDFLKAWKAFISTIINKYISEYYTVNVVFGPVFDDDSNGLFDKVIPTVDKILVPTHYFVLLTYCTKRDTSLKDCLADLSASAYLLPNSEDYYKNVVCGESITEEFFNRNSARIKDVELLTGMSFYNDLYCYEVYVEELKTNIL
ncbi:ORF-13 [Teiidae poxvirus 1]|nr:ORF-13 [Teiidae poxvirus 1]